MNATNNFRNLSQLADAVRESIALLNAGQLSIDELESLTETSRELYERLIVLRHKSYDETAKGVSETSKQETESFEMPFRIDVPTPSNQVTLLDVIEEIESKEPENSQDVLPQPEIFIPPVQDSSGSSDLNHLLGQSRTESLHDRLSKTVSTGSLAQKLEHSPITDLKRAITLNQRFQFSRELFKGDNQEYEVAIDKLNGNSREEAFRHLDTLKSKYNWNNEAQVTQDFLELIERRHLA